MAALQMPTGFFRTQKSPFASEKAAAHGLTSFGRNNGARTLGYRYACGMCDIFARAMHLLVEGDMVASVRPRTASESGGSLKESTFLIHAGLRVGGVVIDITGARLERCFISESIGGQADVATYGPVTAEQLDEHQDRDPAFSRTLVMETLPIALATFRHVVAADPLLAHLSEALRER